MAALAHCQRRAKNQLLVYYKGARCRNPSVRIHLGAEASVPSRHAQHVVYTRRVFVERATACYAWRLGRRGPNLTDGLRALASLDPAPISEELRQRRVVGWW